MKGLAVFDEFYGFLGGDHSYFESSPAGGNPLYDGRKPVEASGYLTEILTDRAVEFIKREKSRPFFLYLAYNAVHTPRHAPEKYLARFKGIADEPRRTYTAMMSVMDDGIGRTPREERAQRAGRFVRVVTYKSQPPNPPARVDVKYNVSLDESM